MKINISGGIDTGNSFPEYVEEGFNKEILKYFDNIPFAEVHLKKQGQNVFTSIVVNDVFKKGVKITAEAEDSDARRSFDGALIKLVSQLKKEKSKALARKKQGA